jgi:hypothetical protein
MRDYRSANSYAARIKEMIMDAKYLYERGLYEQSEERLLSAKELAEELGDQLSAIELNKEYRRLLKYIKREGYENELEQLITESADSLEKLKQELFYLDIYDQLSTEIIKNRQELKEEQKKVLKKRFISVLNKNNEETLILQNKLKFNQCLAFFYQLLNDPVKVHESYNKIINYWDAIPKYKSEEFNRYIVDISNLIQTFISNGNYSNQLNQLLVRLENERPASPHNQNLLFQKITSYRLLFSINTGDFAEILSLVRRIERGLKQYDVSLNTELNIIFNVSVLSFMAGKYDLCQQWANKIIQIKKLSIRQDIQNASRIIYLLATLELDDFESTEICIRNTNRYFIKFSKHEKFNINILNFVRRMHSGTSIQIRNSYRQLKEYIKSFQNSREKAPLGIDELIIFWLESKESNTSISQIIKYNLSKDNN